MLSWAIPILLVAAFIVSWPAVSCRLPAVAGAGIPKGARSDLGTLDRGRTVGSVDAVTASDGRRLVIAGEPESHVSIEYGEDVSIDGWAIDSGAHRLASRVVCRIDATTLQAVYGTSRPDVAKALGSAAFLDSGFGIDIPNFYLTPGRHRLACYVVDASTLRARAFPNRIILNVAEAGRTH